MPIEFNLTCACAACGATASGSPNEMREAGWRRMIVDESNGGRKPVLLGGWKGVSPSDDCVCKDCADAYAALDKKADEARQKAYDSLGKFTPAPDTGGGSGTESDPYTFAEDTLCVVNAFYTHDGTLYVYMPADAEGHSYASWEDAEADFEPWESA